MQLIVDMKADEDIGMVGKAAFKKLCRTAGVPGSLIETAEDQYRMFKERVLAIIKDENSDIRKMNEHFIFQVHKCDGNCSAKTQKKCTLFNKIQLPLKIINMKILHLFLREESLYMGIELFLSIFIKCSVKTHAEGVAESMGNYVDIHSEKRRGLDVAVVGQEAYIHWNGPGVHLGRAVLTVTLLGVQTGDLLPDRTRAVLLLLIE